MMGIEKLIDDYRKAADKWEKRNPVTDTFDLRVQDALRDAATALSTLQAANEKLRAKVERLEYERDYPCIYFKAGGLCRYGGDESEANICVMGPCDVETTAEDVDRLRADLENYRKGHCSEGGCAAEKDRDLVIAENEKLRAELEQVKAERDAAVESIPHECKACMYHTVFFNGCTPDHDCTNPDGGCSNNCDRWKWRVQQKED